MSALDVTAAVEAGARALWEARPDVADLSTWDELDAVIKHKCREHVEPVVTATLAAVQAEVDAAVAQARAEGARVTEGVRALAERFKPTSVHTSPHLSRSVVLALLRTLLAPTEDQP